MPNKASRSMVDFSRNDSEERFALALTPLIETPRYRQVDIQESHK